MKRTKAFGVGIWIAIIILLIVVADGLGSAFNAIYQVVPVWTICVRGPSFVPLSLKLMRFRSLSQVASDINTFLDLHKIEGEGWSNVRRTKIVDGGAGLCMISTDLNRETTYRTPT